MKWLLVAVLLCLTAQLAYAQGFGEVVPLGTNQLIIASNGTYRQTAQTLQLLEGSKQMKLGQWLTANGIYLITDTAERNVYFSPDGLRLQKVMSFTGEYSFRDEPSLTALSINQKIYQLDHGRVINIPADVRFGLDNLLWQGQLVSVFASNQTVIYSQLLNGIWQDVAQLNCEGPSISLKPLVYINCSDQKVYFLEGSSFVLKHVAAWKIEQTEHTILVRTDTTDWFFNGTWQQLQLDPLPTDYKLLGQRLFFQRESEWYEFSSNGNVFYKLGVVQAPYLTSQDGKSVSFVLNGISYYSNEAGKYTAVPEAGLSRIYRFGNLVLGVSSEQHETYILGATAQLLSDSWAASATVESIYCSERCLALIKNSAGAANIYRLEVDQWKRVTLPTKETLWRSVTDIRQLPAGSLIEGEGFVSVPSGIVQKEVMYLTDGLNGIQLYLSSSKGSLTAAVGDGLSFSGEVSSAAVKRILLDGLSQLQPLGINAAPVISSLNFTTLSSSLGKVGRITGTVKEISSSSLVVSGSGTEITIVTLAKPDLKIKDMVSLNVLIDVAGSTLKGWQLSDIELVARQAEPSQTTVTETNVVTSDVKTTNSTPAKAVVAAPTTTQTSVAVKQAAPNTASVSTNIEPSTTLVGGVSKPQTNPFEVVAYTLLGLVAGSLATLRLLGDRVPQGSR